MQLSPWRPFFESFFSKLQSVAIWVQFHNLPVEFWDGDSLETIAGQLGTMINIDEFTFNLVRSKYTRVCIDIDLSKPLCREFWLGDDLHRVFMIVMYVKLPTFYYSCGLIGHGLNKCPVLKAAVNGLTHPSSRVHREPAVGFSQV